MKSPLFRVFGLCAVLYGLAPAAHAQVTGEIAAIPKECGSLGPGDYQESPLPNVVEALKIRKKIIILAIGSTSATMRGPVRGGYYSIIERTLEAAFKPLDVEIIHRGVSGELAADAAVRIKNEVALTRADLVLWQLGTADALARVPIYEFRNTITDQIRWLREHKVDVILVGLRYAANLAKDPQYIGIRTILADVAKAEKVVRLSRFDAEQALAKVKRDSTEGFASANGTEASYVCTAEYITRAIAAGLFVRKGVPPALPPGQNAPPPAPKSPAPI
jgi:acyl-CoA thioesterase I